MNSLITYIFEMNVVLTLFFLVYFLLFRRDANYRNRRAWLLCSMLLAFLLPLLQVRIHNTGGTMPVIPVIALDELIFSEGLSGTSHSSGISLKTILASIYLAVGALLLVRFLISLFHIINQVITSEKTQLYGVSIRKNHQLHSSSFFRFIFLDPEQLDSESSRQIITHELCHVRKIHSMDRIMTEVLIAFSWANPVAWLLRKAVVENHEYQADHSVISAGTRQESYQLTLLQQHIGSASIPVYNSFSNLIKNRLIMLNKLNKRGAAWKIMLVIPVTTVLFLMVSCGNETLNNDPASEAFSDDAEEELFYVVEEMPKWSDGSDMALSVRKHIAENLDYPDEAIKNGVEGKVFVHFIVNSKGKVIIPDPAMLPPELDKGEEREVVVTAYRPINESDEAPDEKYVQLLKDEAVRVVSELPEMIPGKQRGKEVSVIFTMPITFKLD